MQAILPAFSVADGHPSWLVPCPFCGNVHQHGAKAGHRVAHCNTHPNKPSEGYVIEYAGQASDDMIKKSFGRGWKSIVREQIPPHLRASRKRATKA